MRLHFVLSFLVARAAGNRFECTDDSSFALQNRLPCEMWVGRNCWIAHEVLGYSAAEEAELLEACARACSSCAGAPDRQPEPRADCEDTRANHDVHGHGADPCRQWLGRDSRSAVHIHTSVEQTSSVTTPESEKQFLRPHE